MIIKIPSDTYSKEREEAKAYRSFERKVMAAIRVTTEYDSKLSDWRSYEKLVKDIYQFEAELKREINGG